MRPTIFSAFLSSLLCPIRLTVAAETNNILTHRQITETIVANFTIYSDTACTKEPVTVIATTTSGINVCVINAALGDTTPSMTIASLDENCQLELYNRGGPDGCYDSTDQYLGTYAPSQAGPADGCVQVPNFDNPVGGIGDIVQAYVIACSST